jgi:hypothetical protein
MKYEIVHEFPALKTETAWRDLLSRLEAPSHYDSPEFFLEPFWGGKRPFAILAVDGDRMTGVLTGIHERERVISGLPSRPQIAVDPAADVNAVLAALLQGLSKEAKRAKLLTVFSWPSLELTPFTAQGFRRRKTKGNVVLDLTHGADAIFQQFPKDRRRNIRFAEKNAVTVRIAANHEDFLLAYDVYSAWMKAEHRGPKREHRTFQSFEAGQLLTRNRRLFMAELEGRVIAINTFRFHAGGLFESAANFSLNEFLHLKPNDLLQWRGIEWACSQGLRRHSLGGAHPFLLRFGGTVIPIISYRLDRSLLHQYDLRDMVEETARKTLRKMPAPMQAKIRRVLAKER